MEAQKEVEEAKRARVQKRGLDVGCPKGYSSTLRPWQSSYHIPEEEGPAPRPCSESMP